ncbi:MAG: hypothetical protein ACRDGG_11580, partial [Anaerolineae bacterium]
VRADAQSEEEYYLGVSGRWPRMGVWSPDSGWLAFNHAPLEGRPAIWLVEIGTHRLREVDLPIGAGVADWVTLDR